MATTPAQVPSNESPGAGTASPRFLELIGGGAFLLGVAMLARPYSGVVHDARVYIGQAMAALDPGGIGQDMMFAREGQSGFTLFTPAVTALVRALGPGRAAMATGMLGLAVWSLAATQLCRKLAPSRLAPWVCAAWMLIGPGAYGGAGVFHIAESFANPRPFAEAAVMAGLAVFLSGRRWQGAAVVAAAAAIHPLAALSGLGALWVILVLEDRRWLIAAGAGLCAVLAAALLGAPVARRLFELVDPAWLSVLEARNPYLMPTLWRSSDWASLLAAGATAAAALAHVQPRARSLLIGVIVTAALGTAASLAASLAPSVLILQLQTWRTAWLLAALAAACTPILAFRLLGDGGWGRALFALIAIAQLAVSTPAVSMGASLAVIFLLEIQRRRRDFAIPRGVVLALAVAALLIASGGVIGWSYGFVKQALAARDQGVPFSELDRKELLVAAAIAFVALRLSGELRLDGRSRLAVLAGASAGALATGLCLWDARSAFVAASEAQAGPTTAPFRGKVVWTPDEVFVPMATHHAAWLERAQGAGDVFSRTLALEWDRRARLAVQWGLVDRWELMADSHDARRLSKVGAGGLAQACAAPGGPDTIVLDAGMLSGKAPRGTASWRTAAPIYDYDASGWTRRDVFAVVRCR